MNLNPTSVVDSCPFIPLPFPDSLPPALLMKSVPLFFPSHNFTAKFNLLDFLCINIITSSIINIALLNCYLYPKVYEQRLKQ